MNAGFLSVIFWLYHKENKILAAQFSLGCTMANLLHRKSIKSQLYTGLHTPVPWSLWSKCSLCKSGKMLIWKNLRMRFSGHCSIIWRFFNKKVYILNSLVPILWECYFTLLTEFLEHICSFCKIPWSKLYKSFRLIFV